MLNSLKEADVHMLLFGKVDLPLWQGFTNNQHQFFFILISLTHKLLLHKMKQTPVLKIKNKVKLFLHLPGSHSTCSGSASMHVSHGFLGIWGMERMRRAKPQRKRRMKPVQPQAKDHP